MKQLLNQIAGRKLITSGLAMFVPAVLMCAVSIFFGAPWYIIPICFLLIFIASLSAFSVFRNDVINPMNRMREGVDSLLSECLEKEAQTSNDNLSAVLEGLECLRDYLHETKEEQQLYEQNRKDVIAGISHDIGTPLTAIAGCAEALLEDILQTDEQKKMYLETIRNKANELNQLSNDFFMFSCLDMDNLPLHLEKLSFDDAFAPILEEIRDAFLKNNIEFYEIKRGFIDSKPVTLNLDPLQIKRIFQNLANNCIKYMQRSDDMHPEACFSAECLPDKRLRLTLESNGIPVSHEDCGRIFTPYFRTNGAKTSAVNGSGIGLTVCKQLVDLHDGTICARQSVLGGLAIEVTLPVA